VTVDRQGNVFESDVPVSGDSDVVNEYAQQSNTVLRSCNVFVDYNLSGKGGQIAEFKGSLASCTPVESGAHIYHANGMAFDKNDNLIVADGVNRTVDVIKPPYSKINRRLLHFGLPIFVSIDKANKHVFVTAETNYWLYLYVLDYASGKKLRRLGPGHGGIEIPMQAVDGPNDVR
jgi:DNA-binding beta-propeller fold protein YncE